MNETQYINSAQAQALLGISKTTLYKFIKQKKIPASRIGLKWMFNKQELIKLLEHKD